MSDVTIELYRNGRGALQLAIMDENGGYRLAGQKFDGQGKLVQKKHLDERDAAEIRVYLNKICLDPALILARSIAMSLEDENAALHEILCALVNALLAHCDGNVGMGCTELYERWAEFVDEIRIAPFSEEIHGE